MAQETKEKLAEEAVDREIGSVRKTPMAVPTNNIGSAQGFSWGSRTGFLRQDSFASSDSSSSLTSIPILPEATTATPSASVDSQISSALTPPKISSSTIDLPSYGYRVAPSLSSVVMNAPRVEATTTVNNALPPLPSTLPSTMLPMVVSTSNVGAARGFSWGSRTGFLRADSFNSSDLTSTPILPEATTATPSASVDSQPSFTLTPSEMSSATIDLPTYGVTPSLFSVVMNAPRVGATTTVNNALPPLSSTLPSTMLPMVVSTSSIGAEQSFSWGSSIGFLQPASFNLLDPTLTLPEATTATPSTSVDSQLSSILTPPEMSSSSNVLGDSKNIKAKLNVLPKVAFLETNAEFDLRRELEALGSELILQLKNLVSQSKDSVRELKESRGDFAKLVAERGIVLDDRVKEMAVEAENGLARYEEYLAECAIKLGTILESNSAIISFAVMGAGQPDTLTTTIDGGQVFKDLTGIPVELKNRFAICKQLCDRCDTEINKILRLDLSGQSSVIPEISATFSPAVSTTTVRATNNMLPLSPTIPSAPDAINNTSNFARGFFGAVPPSSDSKNKPATQGPAGSSSPVKSPRNLSFVGQQSPLVEAKGSSIQVSNMADAEKHFAAGEELLIEKRDYKNAILHFEAILNSEIKASNLIFLHRTTLRLGEALFKDAKQTDSEALGRAKKCFDEVVNLEKQIPSKSRKKSYYRRFNRAKELSAQCEAIESSLSSRRPSM